MTGAESVVARLVERATLDGATFVPEPVLAAALRVAGFDQQRGGHSGRAEPAELESRLTDLLLRLLAGRPDGLLVVDCPRGTDPGPVLEPLTESVTASGGRVVQRADLLDLAAAVELVEALPDGARLVLVGDPDLPPGPAAGQVLVDIVASGVVPVVAAPLTDGEPDQLGLLVQTLRTGLLPVLDPQRRELVVTPAADAEEAVRRTVQLVTDSVPRVFGVGPDEVLVVSLRADGRTGVDALRTALAGAGAGDVDVCGRAEAVGRSAEAIVLVLGAEAAGSLTRDVLVGAATEAARHLSVVHQAGPALADAVARRPHRFRRTHLAGLLAGGVPAGVG